MTSESNAAGMNSTINITPMIDVLLVLLIIFMVIVPAMPRGESARIPQSSKSEFHRDSGAVVMEVHQAGRGHVSFRINQQDVPQQTLPSRLMEIYANRAQKTLFLKGDDKLNFMQIAEVIDIGHAAGIERVALLTPGVQSAQQ
jgi:biopolymer transport protein ExbD